MADGNHVTCFFCIKVMLHVLYKNKSYSKRGFTSASCQLLFLFDFSNISQAIHPKLYLLVTLSIFIYLFHVLRCRWNFQPKRHVTWTTSSRHVVVFHLGAAGMSIVKQLHITTRLTTSKRHPTNFFVAAWFRVAYIYINSLWWQISTKQVHLRERFFWYDV